MYCTVLYCTVQVLCLDIHPVYPHLLVAGLADGNIAVYSLTNTNNTPKLLSRVSLLIL